MGFSQPVEKRGRRSARRGWYVLIALALIGLGALAWHFVLRPLFETGFGQVDTRPVSGDPARFDPVRALPDIQAYAGPDANLIAMEAHYVSAGGTVDLTAQSYWPEVKYTFTRQVPRPADAPPIGAGGSAGPWYEAITVTAQRVNQWWFTQGSGRSYQYMNRGLQRGVEKPSGTLDPTFLDSPACTFEDLWQVALAREAPADAVAIIEYGAEGYRFYIPNTDVYLFFDPACKPIAGF